MRTVQIAILVAAVVAMPAHAKEHVVRMLNKGAAGPMVFEPALLKVVPGDSVRFEPTDLSHNAESIAGMIPAEAAAFKGKLNQPITVKFTVPGVYGYKCLPHYIMGMVGVVVVGKPTNLAQASSVVHPGKSKQVFTGLLAQAGAKSTR